MSVLRGEGDFTIRKIQKLRDLNKSKGIHLPNSGFYEIFNRYYADHEMHPEEVMKELERERTIQLRPVKDGYMMYIYGEAPGSIDKKASTCDIIKSHHEFMKNDPEHLTTDFIQKKVGRKCIDVEEERRKKKKSTKPKRKCRCK